MFRDLGLLALRLGTGTILMAHGYTKLFGGPGKSAPADVNRLLGPNFQEAVEQGGIDNFSKALESMGVPEPRKAAMASGIAEFGGGLCLALGYRTGLAGTVAATNMAVATRKVHWSQGFYGPGGWELSGLLGLVAAVLVLTGPGAISLDALRKR